jgi:hypothetical protein
MLTVESGTADRSLPTLTASSSSARKDEPMATTIKRSLQDLLEAADFQPQAFLSDVMAASLRGDIGPALATKLGTVVQAETAKRAAKRESLTLPHTTVAALRVKLLALLARRGQGAQHAVSG